MMTNSPLASLAKQHGINFNPSGTKNMLQYAANRQPGAGATEQPEEVKGGQVEAEESKEEEKVNVAQFRTAKQDQIDKRAR